MSPAPRSSSPKSGSSDVPLKRSTRGFSILTPIFDGIGVVVFLDEENPAGA